MPVALTRFWPHLLRRRRELLVAAVVAGAACAAGALAPSPEKALGQSTPQPTAQRTPQGRTTYCQGTAAMDAVTDTLRICEQSEINVSAEAVCPVCPAGVNVIFVIPRLAHDPHWLRQEAFGIIDILQSWQRDERADFQVNVGVVRYDHTVAGAGPALFLTDNIQRARGPMGSVSQPMACNGLCFCYPVLGYVDRVGMEVQRMLRRAHQNANLGDDDPKCDYVVLFIEGLGPHGQCGGFMVGENSSRAIRAAKQIERQVGEGHLLVGCPGEGSNCDGPREMPSNRRNYAESPLIGALRRRIDDEIDALTKPHILRQVTIQQQLPPEVAYVPDSAAPTPGVVTVDDTGTRLEWEWRLVRVEGPHDVTYRVQPQATGVFTLTGAVDIADEHNRWRTVPLAPATLDVPSECVPPPTETPTPTVTATATATSTHTATPTPTREPGPLFLPLALKERCDEERRAADVVLIIDASTSMLEDAGGGRSKLDAAVAAAGSFIDRLALTAGRDQAAVVSFNSEAHVLQALTTDRAALTMALQGIAVAPSTCLSCAVDAGRLILEEGAGRVRTPTLILLTDGRSNPEPSAVAVERAAAAKNAGIVIFTIGVGTELDVEALTAIASAPRFFYQSVDAQDLEEIYAEIARLIPCQAYWPKAR